MRYFIVIFSDYVLVLASTLDKNPACSRFEVRSGDTFHGYSYAQLREHGNGELEEI